MRGVRRAVGRSTNRSEATKPARRGSYGPSIRLQRTPPCRRILLALLLCVCAAVIVLQLDIFQYWNRPSAVFHSNAGGEVGLVATGYHVPPLARHVPWHMQPAVVDWVARCPWPRIGIAVVTRHCPIHEMEYWLDFHLRRGVCHVWLRVQDTPALRYLLFHPKYRGKVTARFVGDNPYRKHYGHDGSGARGQQKHEGSRSEPQKKKAADWFGSGYGKFKFQTAWVNEAAYNASDLGIDWMLHIDDDELLYPMLTRSSLGGIDERPPDALPGTGLLCKDDRPPLQHVPRSKPIDSSKYPEVYRRQQAAESREREPCAPNLIAKQAESIPALFRKITTHYADIHDVHFINWEILAPPELHKEPHNGAFMPKFRYSNNMVLKGARIAYGNGKSAGKVCRGKKPGEQCLKNYGPHYMAFNDPETGFFNHTREARFDISALDAVVVHFESPTFEAWLAKFSHSSNSTDKIVFGFYKDSIRRMVEMREFWVGRKAASENEARSAFMADLEPYPGTEIEELDRGP